MPGLLVRSKEVANERGVHLHVRADVGQHNALAGAAGLRPIDVVVALRWFLNELQQSDGESYAARQAAAGAAPAAAGGGATFAPAAADDDDDDLYS